ncbi:MAG: hypothetical protein AAF328_03060 [Planctomycetota bacterium]
MSATLPTSATEVTPDLPRTPLRHAHSQPATPTELWGPTAAQAQLLHELTHAGFTAQAQPATQQAPLPAQAFLALHRKTPTAVFARAVAALRKHQRQTTEEIRPTDVLHPVARAAWINLPDTGRFAVTGFAGHGNMLLHALLAALDQHALGPNDQRPFPEKCASLHYDANHHGQALRHALSQLNQHIADDRRTTVQDYTVSGSDRVDAAAARVQFADGHTLLIEGIPYAGFVGQDYGAHIPWDADTVRFFQQTGFRRVYCIVREPLAGIASNASKTLRPCEPVLHHPAWLDQCARTMANFLSQVDRHREHFRLVRFEDLLEHPIAALRRFADDAGYKLSKHDARAIWDRVGFRPLTPAGHEHLVDPLADKYPLFRRSQYDQLQSSGILDMFTPFGYTQPTPDRLPDAPLVPLTDELVRNAPSLLYGRPDPTQLIHRSLPHLRLEVRATDESLADTAARRVEEDDFVAILRSLGDGLLRHRTAHAL